jgi:acyl-CoA dehydrogenase
LDFAIDADTQLLLETMERFVRERLQPLEAAVEATGALDPAIAAAIFTEARTLGLYGMNMPEICGGGGLSTVQMCLVEERLGHTKDILIRRAFGNVYEVLLACEGPQVKRWLEPAVTGDRVCSIAITEPSAGSDARAVTTRAVRDSNQWRLNGHKHFISDADFSDFFVVLAQTDTPELAGRPSLFLVDKNLDGMRCGHDQPMMGLSGTKHIELFFDDVVLDADCLLAQVRPRFSTSPRDFGTHTPSACGRARSWYGRSVVRADAGASTRARAIFATHRTVSICTTNACGQRYGTERCEANDSTCRLADRSTTASLR